MTQMRRLLTSWRACGKEYNQYGANAIQELAAASKVKALDHLHAVAADVQKHGDPVRVPQCKDIRKLLSEQTDKSVELPWQRADQAAKGARQVWGLPSGPVKNSTLADIFGVKLSESFLGEGWNSQQLPFSAGMLDGKIEDGFRVSLSQRHVDSRRFTLARLVGDYIETQEGEPLLPATRAKTSRQKFQRAFCTRISLSIRRTTRFYWHDIT